ncbi:MAG: TlpA disulfide reductase family protein [Thiomicrorhabdus chilensis]|uniref:TlpA disulfide reductase family protein n=1 Tax=Thiomicrorhabdus chilensis TaxID=63656 RepID=UPI00299DEC51|nr:TlpA disulfide reductase family protein [Thiomicrorhabdus chilensis]MDX1347974.1 TlpA disulfide reductase family protein [Thiomicrorhabdus chilensis]
MASKCFGVAACLAIWFSLVSGAFASERVLEFDEASVPIQVVKASGLPKARLLWLPSEYGVLQKERDLAVQLAKNGIESWFVNYYEVLFLAPTPSAVDEVPDEWIAATIQASRNPEDSSQALPLWIIAPNKAAQLAVRGLAQAGELSEPLHHLGLILINPNLYLKTPKPGEAAQYWPQVSSMNLPVGILQAELSPWRWRLKELATQLRHSGSEVFVNLEPKVRDRFYFRNDALAYEKAVSQQLADKLRRMMQIQLAYLPENRVMGKVKKQSQNRLEVSRTTELQAYQGEQDLPLELLSLDGLPVSLKDFQGKVVLLNFWASWCPPCVHEMPSMARLKTDLQNRSFEILAVNLAEEQTAIQTFLDEHPVNFPVLQDPTGSAVKTWQVFAYPSTYLIDKQGKIRFALFGGTEWDQASHLQKIEPLLSEAEKVE